MEADRRPAARHAGAAGVPAASSELKAPRAERLGNKVESKDGRVFLGLPQRRPGISTQKVLRAEEVRPWAEQPGAETEQPGAETEQFRVHAPTGALNVNTGGITFPTFPTVEAFIRRTSSEVVRQEVSVSQRRSPSVWLLASC